MDRHGPSETMHEQMDSLRAENQKLRAVVAELSAAFGFTPPQAVNVGVSAAVHNDCRAARHAQDLQRRLDGIVYLTRQVDVTNSGLVAVCLADIRMTAGEAR